MSDTEAADREFKAKREDEAVLTLVLVSMMIGMFAGMAVSAAVDSTIAGLAAAAGVPLIYAAVGLPAARLTQFVYSAALGAELLMERRTERHARLWLAVAWPIAVPVVLLYALVRGIVERLAD